MHININLLPPEMVWQQQKLFRQRLIISVWVLVLLALLILLFILKGITNHHYHQLMQWQSKLTVIETEMQSLQRYDLEQKQYQKRQLLLCQAEGTPPDWLQLLTSIGLYLPPDVWLNYLSATYVINPSPTANDAEPNFLNHNNDDLGQDANVLNQNTPPVEIQDVISPTYDNIPTSSLAEGVGELSIRGLAMDYVAVAHFLQKMQQVPGVDTVRCRYAAEQQLADQKLVIFEVRAALLPTTINQTTPAQKEGD